MPKSRHSASRHPVAFPSLSQPNTTPPSLPSELQANPRSVTPTRCPIPTISGPTLLSTRRAIPQGGQASTCAAAVATGRPPRKRTHEATYSANESEITQGNARARQRTTSSSSVETIRAKAKKVVEHVMPTPKARDTTTTTVKQPIVTGAASGIARLKRLRDKLTVMAPHTSGFDPGRGVAAKEVIATPSVRGVTHKQGRENQPRRRCADILAAAGSEPVESDQDCCLGHALLSSDTSSSVSPSESDLDNPFPPKVVEVKAKDIRAKSGLNPVAMSEARVPFLPLANAGGSNRMAVVGSESVPPGPPSLTNENTTPVIQTDKLGRIKLSAADLDLSITFYDSPHFEIWDQADDIYVALPAQIHLTTKGCMSKCDIVATPNVTRIEIECHAKPSPTARYLICESESGFTVTYRGAKTRKKGGQEVPMMHENGICIDPGWWPTSMKDSGRRKTEATEREGKRSWSMKAWIPIPTELFMKRETRTFVVEAGIWIRDKHGGVAEVVNGQGEMSVSHLRKCREMN